ncbi:hypothetical protein [Sporosarcina sp. SAFN-015]|uniref:hypothetical protein n=1 Tax=Sporosarcina sp. SAFN-015 TaxID=3387274 RepID=UPI003F7F3E26
MTGLSAQIEGDLIALLDDWFSLPEVFDDALDSQIHAWYVSPPKVWPQKPYFSPSSLGSCPRELYLKAKGAKRDNFRRPPHQARQAKMGTLTGDMIQRELLFIEKHYERLTGNAPRFRFLRDEQGRPRFEEFAKANVKVTHNGETFYLSGAPDGIMEYITDDGEAIRVGLEIKSKASTAAKTSHYSMREPDASHRQQATAYARMFGCSYYVVLYLNLAKKGWFMSDEDYAKTPDLRAFCLRITDEDIAQVLDKPAYVTRCVREGTPPPLSLDDWTFNGFKTACALDLTDDEFAELIEVNHRAQHSNMSASKKRDYAAAIEFITETRKGTL